MNDVQRLYTKITNINNCSLESERVFQSFLDLSEASDLKTRGKQLFNWISSIVILSVDISHESLPKDHNFQYGYPL